MFLYSLESQKVSTVNIFAVCCQNIEKKVSSVCFKKMDFPRKCKPICRKAEKRFKKKTFLLDKMFQKMFKGFANYDKRFLEGFNFITCG